MLPTAQPPKPGGSGGGSKEDAGGKGKAAAFGSLAAVLGRAARWCTWPVKACTGCCAGPRVAMPQSVTEAWICYVALALFFPAALLVKASGVPFVWRMVAISFVPAATIVCLEWVYLQPRRRPGTGLQFASWAPNRTIIQYKWLGFNAVLAVIGFFYYVLAEYDKDMYRNWFTELRTLGPFCYAACFAYFVAVDGYQTDAAKAADMYHNTGRLLLRRPLAAPISAERWGQFGREYLVKAFFLPLMFTFYSNSLQSFERNITPISDAIVHGNLRFVPFFAFCYDTIFFVDVVWATFGYALSCKLLDSHVRSAEPTTFGWVAAIVCYPPVGQGTLDAYFNYGGGAWGRYFKDAPRWFFHTWGCSILILSAIYAWATVVFGVRFSNLTHRGVLTNGPYAFTRHPAYVCKNLSWWLISVPWDLRDGPRLAFCRCVRLGCVNLIYFARAMTEEAHLLRDPAYLDYYNAIQARYGLPLRPAPAAGAEPPDGGACGEPGGGGGALGAPERQALLNGRDA